MSKFDYIPRLDHVIIPTIGGTQEIVAGTADNLIQPNHMYTRHVGDQGRSCEVCGAALGVPANV